MYNNLRTDKLTTIGETNFKQAVTFLFYAESIITSYLSLELLPETKLFTLLDTNPTLGYVL